MKKVWKAIGGRKFLALLLACGVYLYTREFAWSLTAVFGFYMFANVLTKYPAVLEKVLGKMMGASGDE
ncbi:MAG: hypothetical protein JW885_02750 [Deltaproteobacteria bacterium]|nr:hypothetical protein [Candidatus Zymogenaceae bacterium]